MSTDSSLDSIQLSHGQAKWVLTHALDLSDPLDSALDSYIKLLRRGGVPFGPGETPGGSGTNIQYRYHHLMSLALALVLRRQGILRTDVIHLLASMQNELRPLFRRAWFERKSGLGARVEVAVGCRYVAKGSGIWLDLGLNYSNGGLLMAMDPKLLGPEGAVEAVIAINRQLFFRDPIRISDIANKVVRLAPEAPEVRRGRP